MARYEYRVLSGSPTGHFLMPWASQELRDKIGRGSLEKQLNILADDGWEILSCSTTTAGNFLFHSAYATVILRREKQ
jgi:hypothetical protein